MEIGTILADRYQICELLSHKAGRLTLLTRDLLSQTLVIIKILRFDRDFHWDDLKLFEREAATLQNLNHSAIPKYLDSFELPDGFALVQTYIDAPSLETVVKAGRKFSESEVLELASRLLDILTYLHEQQPSIVHRDIKPSNILLANRSGHSIGDVYLVDFGSVQAVASKDGGTITIVGSYGYIPLEQFCGQATTASDLYSLGMTLIYLLTGTHPAELTQVNGQVKFTAEISGQFKRWLEKMTQHHLDKRFDSAKLARTALTSQNGSYGDFTHLKPANTQIKLYRDRNRLEIRGRDILKIEPTKNFLDRYISKDSQAIWSCLGYIVVFPLAVCFIPLWILYGLIEPFLSLLLARKLKNCRLTIEKEHILFYQQNLLSKLETIRKETRDRVAMVVYSHGYTFDKYLDSDGRIQNRGKVSVSCKLYILCGDIQFTFNSDRLSPTELWWLGQELSDFLNLELQVIYPTPKVPAAPSCGGGC